MEKKAQSLFFKNPYINKKMSQIYELLDVGYFEITDIALVNYINDYFTVFLPPFIYKGKLIKGVYSCSYCDCANATYHNLNKLFFSIESSFWCSYPKAKTADAYFTVYKNTVRENYFRQKFPEKNHIKLIPLQEADLVNEKFFKPSFIKNKITDVLYITRFAENKNIEVFIKALKIFKEKYGYKLNADFVYSTIYAEYNKNLGINSKFAPFELEVIDFLDKEIPDWREYVNIYSNLPPKEILKKYREAKMYVFTSLLEGSNRTIREAMYTNTPVVLFKDYNRYARGESLLLTPQMGIMTEEFSAEALADSIFKMLKTYGKYKPRKAYLKIMNRQKCIDICLKSLEYYNDIIYTNKCNSIFRNKEIKKAIFDTYRIDYKEFIYNKYPILGCARFSDKGSKLFDYYINKFKSHIK